ncbi:MAG: serine/threonine-protein kinase [Vicinamibacterales bacterium]
MWTTLLCPCGLAFWYRRRHPTASRGRALVAVGLVLGLGLVVLFFAYWLGGAADHLDMTQAVGLALATATGLVAAAAGDVLAWSIGRDRRSREGEPGTWPDEPGVLSRRYRLERRLGRGGMGTVYAARDLVLDRTVAVKMLVDGLADAPGALERFQREARATAAFGHPNVVTVFDFGVSGSRPFLVMELLQGRTLREVLRAEERLEARRAIGVLKDVAAAVEAAHARHMIHCDLKPENIFLVPDGDGGERAKVLDFGLAMLMSTPEFPAVRTAAGLVDGTPLYMAPEQIRGEAPGAGWDVWALAVIASEMLSGVHPFASLTAASEDPEAVPAPLPEALRQVLGRALAVDPRLRPLSAQAFVTQLETAVHV